MTGAMKDNEETVEMTAVAVGMEQDAGAAAAAAGGGDADATLSGGRRRRSSVFEAVQRSAAANRKRVVAGVITAAIVVAVVVGVVVWQAAGVATPSKIVVPQTFSAEFHSQSKQVSSIAYSGRMFKSVAADGSWNLEMVVESDPSVMVNATTKLRYTLLNKRVYVQQISLATGAVLSASCMNSNQVPPLMDVPQLFAMAPLVPNAEFNPDVIGECSGDAHAKYVLQWGTPTARAQNSFVYCALADGSHQLVGHAFIATLFNVNIEPSAGGLGLSVPTDSLSLSMNCPQLEQTSAFSPAAAERRRLATPAASEISEHRRLAAAAAWWAASPMRVEARRLGGYDSYKCYFMHGSGYSTDTSNANSFSAYWGSVEDETTGYLCGSSVTFIRRNMNGVRWTDSTLQQYFCNQIVTSGSTASNIILFTHGTGSLLAAGAFYNGLCTLATSSKWYAIGSPFDGTPVSTSAAASPSICSTEATALGTFFGKEGTCSSTSASQASQATTTSFMSSNSIRSAVNGKLSGWMCGTDDYGLHVSGKTDMLANVADYVSFGSSTHDGFTKTSSCQDASTSYSTYDCSTSRYRPSVNHLDLTCRAGDAAFDVWGDLSPCSYYWYRT